MNFFGHAAVARWYLADAPAPPDAGALALGAMLPDFASMCGARLGSSDDADVARGIDLHHRTDAAFHTLPVVVGLMRELGAALTARGCRRGPMRAASHIGVELLLDGVLVDDPDNRAIYLAALEVAEGRASRLRWNDAGDASRFAVLVPRLRAHGVPDDLRQPSSVASRLVRVMSGRPLLSANAADASAIRDALAASAERIRAATPTVLRALAATLATGS